MSDKKITSSEKKNIEEKNIKKTKRDNNKKDECKEEIRKEAKKKTDNKNKDKRNTFNTLEVLIIMFITLCFGGLLGSALTYAIDNKEQIITSVPEELDEFISTYEDIKSNYYEEIDESELVNAGIEGMLDFLDDKYSIYMDEKETEDFNQQVEGSYVGIGSEIQRLENGDTIIFNPFEGGPAAKAGLEVGDVILKVDNQDVTSLTLDEISNMAKGQDGTTVKITIKRNDEEREIEVIRGKVELTSVTGKIIEMDEKKVGYIDIEIFAANTTKQFEKKLLELESEGISSLVIDVRANSGGYLTTVEEIASLFLKKGKIIYKLDTKGIVETIKDKTKTSRDYPVVVVTDKASASASEILAAVIKESYDNGEVVGVNTYGKGTVQKAHQLESGATIKYTIQKWLTPNGNWINEKGVEPTLKVEMNEKYFENPTEETDNQLQEALRIASEKA